MFQRQNILYKSKCSVEVKLTVATWKAPRSNPKTKYSTFWQNVECKVLRCAKLNILQMLKIKTR